MARRTGIEPVTPSLEGWCSIRLSYRRIEPEEYTKYATDQG